MASSEFHLIHSLVTKFSSILLQHYLSISRDGTSLHYGFDVGQWPGLVIVARIALPHTIRGASGSGSIRRVTKLNTLVPDVWLFPCQRIVGELGKDRLFDEHFGYILKLNHGVFHAI